MLRLFGKIPRESRVLGVLSLAVLLQVFVLAAFGLSAVKGQAAETERKTREICRRVLERNLAGELTRLFEEGLAAARNPIASLRVQSPLTDPLFARALHEASAPSRFVREAFLVLPGGAVWDADRNPLSLPEPPPVPAPAGDRASPFEAAEREADAGADPAALADSVAEILAQADPAWRPAGLMLLARLSRRAGRPEEALAAFDRLCREHPATLDRRERPPVPVGLEAARCRAALRLALLAEGRATPDRVVDDLLALRRLLTVNRGLAGRERAGFEAAAFEDLASRARPALPEDERARLDSGLLALARREKDLDLVLRHAGDELLALRPTAEPEQRVEKAVPSGTLTLSIVPLRDRAGAVAGAVGLLVDTPRLLADVLPGLVAGLPLPEGIAASVVDAAGRPAVAGGPPVRGEPVAEAHLAPALPLHTARLFATGAGVGLREAAAARRLIYGIMALSIAGLLAAAWFVTRTVRAEIRVARMKSDFLSNVTHELKTPLTSIRMFVETLQEGRVRDEEERREYLDVIGREAERLHGLIQRVLDLSRLESRGRAGITRQDTDLAALLSETADIFRRRAAGQGVDLAVEVPSDLPRFPLDPGAVQGLVLNLLTNAQKYGGKRIVLRASAGDGAARIEVRDDGIGIPEAEQGRIFEKFYRVNDTLARDVEGTGLGLAYVREVARAHGGRATVRSRPGEGSTFTVTLPGR